MASDPIDLASWKFVEAAVRTTDSLSHKGQIPFSAQTNTLSSLKTLRPLPLHTRDVSARIFDSSWGTLNESGELSRTA
jgi:hypothetical protein